MKQATAQPIVNADNTLAGMLDIAVRLRILALQEMCEADFKFNWRDWTREEQLAASGLWNEQILFGSKRQGETATAFNAMAKAVAALAFVPGGVTVFNTHYEAKREQTNAE